MEFSSLIHRSGGAVQQQVNPNIYPSIWTNLSSRFQSSTCGRACLCFQPKGKQEIQLQGVVSHGLRQRLRLLLLPPTPLSSVLHWWHQNHLRAQCYNLLLIHHHVRVFPNLKNTKLYHKRFPIRSHRHYFRTRVHELRPSVLSRLGAGQARLPVCRQLIQSPLLARLLSKPEVGLSLTKTFKLSMNV